MGQVIRTDRFADYGPRTNRRRLAGGSQAAEAAFDAVASLAYWMDQPPPGMADHEGQYFASLLGRLDRTS